MYPNAGFFRTVAQVKEIFPPSLPVDGSIKICYSSTPFFPNGRKVYFCFWAPGPESPNDLPFAMFLSSDLQVLLLPEGALNNDKVCCKLDDPGA